MKRFLLIASALLVLSCKSGNDGLNLVQYREGEQLLTMNGVERNGEEFIAPRILRLSKDSVLVGEELLVKIFLNDKDIAIVDALVDCKLVANSRKVFDMKSFFSFQLCRWGGVSNLECIGEIK